MYNVNSRRTSLLDAMYSQSTAENRQIFARLLTLILGHLASYLFFCLRGFSFAELFRLVLQTVQQFTFTPYNEVLLNTKPDIRYLQSQQLLACI